MNSPAHQSAKIIQQIKPDFVPKLAIVLGSGLTGLTELIRDKVEIPYEQLVGFPKIDVEGHVGSLILGNLKGTNVACLQGRSHKYEHIHDDYVITYVRTLRLLGATHFLATNASGSLNPDFPPGSLVQISDHINFQGSNPLIGENDNDFGPRFPPMDNAYCPAFNALIEKEAQHQSLDLKKGTYISVLGPSYETAAEIKMFRNWGADAIGMSTVPEVIVANHCGFKVSVIATITNFATGLEGCVHDHKTVVKVANQNAKRLQHLVEEVASKLTDA